MNQKHTNNPKNTAAAQFLVSAAARPILIEAEMRQSKINSFVEEYNSLTGENENWQTISASGHAMDVGDDKWGIEVRIYFPKNDIIANQMRRYGFSVNDGDLRMRDSHRINNRELFRELVEVHGLRIGNNA